MEKDTEPKYYDFFYYYIMDNFSRNDFIEDAHKCTISSYIKKNYKLYEDGDIKDLFKSIITSRTVRNTFKNILKNINEDLYTIKVLWLKEHHTSMRGNVAIFVRLYFNELRDIVVSPAKYNKNIQYIHFIVDVINQHMMMIRSSKDYD